MLVDCGFEVWGVGGVYDVLDGRWGERVFREGVRFV